MYGYALSRIKSTPHHHSHALRRPIECISVAKLDDSTLKLFPSDTLATSYHDIVANLARPRFRCLAPRRPWRSDRCSATELAPVCVVDDHGAASSTKRGASQHQDRPISCVSCSPIRWSSSRAKSAVGEVGGARTSTDHDVSSGLVGGVVSAGASPDLLSGLGAWVLVMCIGVVSRER